MKYKLQLHRLPDPASDATLHVAIDPHTPHVLPNLPCLLGRMEATDLTLDLQIEVPVPGIDTCKAALAVMDVGWCVLGEDYRPS